VKYWLNLCLSALALGSLLAAFQVTPWSDAPAAIAEEVPTITQAATNGSLWAGADANGALYWSENSGTTWTSTGFGLTKSGVSSVIWNGSAFLATSYFEGARSSDGKTGPDSCFRWDHLLTPATSLVMQNSFAPGP